MSVKRQSFWSRFKLKPREQRLLVYLAVVLCFVAWKFLPRPWHPTTRLQTPHHVIESTATLPQTEETGRALTALYDAYLERFAALPSLCTNHPPLRVKLFKDRNEFRRINPGLGWAEAYYRKPYCRAYYAECEANPFHWMVHEAAHQLNTEVGGLNLEKWLEEGLADYYGTSLIVSNRLLQGQIDPETYPVWWLDELATHPTLEENLCNGSVIPLRAIVTNSGGPSLNRNVNLYYLHWWTLAHFVFEHPKHRDQAFALVKEGGGLTAFEKHIGPLNKVQVEWHAHVRKLKSELAPAGLQGGRQRRDGGNGLIRE
jgi:hypothetical protein